MLWIEVCVVDSIAVKSVLFVGSGEFGSGERRKVTLDPK